MKKIILVLFCFIINTSAQTLPDIFELGGTSLRKNNDNNPAGNSIEDIVIVGDTIWLATGNGLSRSIDNGETWKNYYNTEPFGTEGIARVAYKNGIIYASTWHSEELFGRATPVGTGLKYSTDNGETWTSIPQPKDSINQTSIVYGINQLVAVPINVLPDNYIRGLAVTDEAIWIACFGGGVRKSTDRGLTWQRVVLPPDNLNSISPSDTLNFRIDGNINLNHLGQSVTVSQDGTIWVGTSNGINKSSDGGISWTKITHDNREKSISGDFIIKMRFNDFDNAIWASTWKGKSETEYWSASVSFDGGENWQSYLPGTRPHDFGFLRRGNFASSETIIVTEDGVFRTNNNGNSWIAAPEIVDNVSKVKIVSDDFRSVAVNQNESGNHIWLGSTSNGLAKITETGSSMWQGDWKVFLASEKLADEGTAKAFPNPFAPSREKIKIQFTTNNTDAEVSIRIFDFGMNLVKTLLQNASRTSAFDEYFEFWDGRNENGKVVPNGVYFYRIDIGNNDPLFGKIMVLN